MDKKRQRYQENCALASNTGRRIRQRLELELDSQGDLIGLGQQTRTEGVSVEATEARVFHSQAQCLGQIVAQTHAIVDAVALPPRVSDDQCQWRRQRSGVALRITQAAV